MRQEKQYIRDEYLARLKSSPFFIVVDYRSLKVHQFTELRKRLRQVGSELRVVKNSIFRIAAHEAQLADLKGSLSGQVAVVTGQQDVSAAAKVVKTFQTEFEKPKLQFGYLKDQRLEAADVLALADLPSIEVLRGKLVGLIQAPATRLAAVLSAPGSQLARVIKARSDQAA
ncbi:MAG: 50S ribosomal protein L10 [Verrucomicrobia bacterium]|nr:50S ribosomal protein L10 [Verrucomicrobiota bacterium]